MKNITRSFRLTSISLPIVKVDEKSNHNQRTVFGLLRNSQNQITGTFSSYRQIHLGNRRLLNEHSQKTYINGMFKRTRKNQLELSIQAIILLIAFITYILSSNQRPDLFPNPVVKTSSSNDRTWVDTANICL